MVWRQPFPGPGLAIRIVGSEATEERLELRRAADEILLQESAKRGSTANSGNPSACYRTLEPSAYRETSEPMDNL